LEEREHSGKIKFRIKSKSIKIRFKNSTTGYDS